MLDFCNKKLVIILFLICNILIINLPTYSFSIEVDGEEIELAVPEEKKDRFFELYNYFKNNIEQKNDVQDIQQVDNGNIIYLTFDDGPGDDSTDRILEVLDKYNIKATFFLCDTAYKDKISRIYKSGHQIGLHTSTHRFVDIYQNELTYLENMYKVDNEVFKKIGKHVKLIRFPGGSNSKLAELTCPGITDRLIKIMKNLGFEYYDWNVDTGDSNSASSNRQLIYSNFFNGCNKNMHAKTVLFHDVVQATSYILDDILKKATELGYDFRIINEYTKPIHFK